jgi:hypothetical protein
MMDFDPFCPSGSDLCVNPAYVKTSAVVETMADKSAFTALWRDKSARQAA